MLPVRKSKFGVTLRQSDRLNGISSLFGQIPDVLEDVWTQVAFGEIDKARKTIDAVPHQHPFRLCYHRVEKVEWESCAAVLSATCCDHAWLRMLRAGTPLCRRWATIAAAVGACYNFR